LPHNESDDYGIIMSVNSHVTLITFQLNAFNEYVMMTMEVIPLL